MASVSLLPSALLQVGQRQDLLTRSQANRWAHRLAGCEDEPGAVRERLQAADATFARSQELLALVPEDDEQVPAPWRPLCRIGSQAWCRSWVVANDDGRLGLGRLLPGSCFADRAQRRVWLDSLQRQPRECRYLVPLLDAQLVDDDAFAVYAWTPGIDLVRRHIRRGIATEQRALTLIRHAAKGLRDLQTAGCRHGLLRPSSLLIGADLRGHLADAGLLAGPGRHGLLPGCRLTTIGHEAWLAPEQLDGGCGDSRSDIYSLGALLFFLLAGRPPFAGSGKHLLRTIRSQPRPDVRTAHAGISDATTRCIVRCLRIRPEKRHASLDDLINDLLGIQVRLQREAEARSSTQAGTATDTLPQPAEAGSTPADDEATGDPDTDFFLAD